jgi:hypothetical protein
MTIQIKQFKLDKSDSTTNAVFESLVKEGEVFMNEIAELDELLNSLIIDDNTDEEVPDYDYIEIDR